MSHLSHEQLWAYFTDDVGAPERAQAAEHLAGCAACTQRLAEVKVARGLLVPRGEVPPLPDASARRIGEVLARAAEAEAVRKMSWRGWWALKPLLFASAVAAALLLWVLWPAPPSPNSPQQFAQPTPAPGQPKVPPELAVPRPPEPQRLAQVTSARKARVEGGALAKNQSLTSGTRVTTDPGGALWLKLPDGSRAGLSASTDVTLAALGDKRVDLDVAQGDLVVVARHDPSRLLSVRAGEVEVRDVGTRFLVSRDAARVLVAVEEGAVEVRLPERTVPLTAGHALEVRSGKTTELPWQTVSARPSEKPGRLIPDLEATPAIPADAATVANARGTNPPVEDWPAAPRPTVDAGTAATVAARPVEAKDAGVAGPPEESLDSIGMAFKKFGEAISKPFKPSRSTLAGRINDLADEGNCDDAIELSKPWLAADGGTSEDEANQRLVVLRATLRCYTRTGKTTEADAIRRQLP